MGKKKTKKPESETTPREEDGNDAEDGGFHIRLANPDAPPETSPELLELLKKIAPKQFQEKLAGLSARRKSNSLLKGGAAAEKGRAEGVNGSPQAETKRPDEKKEQQVKGKAKGQNRRKRKADASQNDASIDEDEPSFNAAPTKSRRLEEENAAQKSLILKNKMFMSALCDDLKNIQKTTKQLSKILNMSNGISKLLVSLQSDYDEKYKESQQVIQTHVSSFATHMEEMLKHLS